MDEWRRDLIEVGCVICRRLGYPGTPCELHHVAEGSGLRSDWSTVGLCSEHHRGKSGLHGMGTKAFLRLYRVPGEAEWGLLLLAIEDVAKFRAGELRL